MKHLSGLQKYIVYFGFFLFANGLHAQGGLSLYGDLKYDKDYSHVDYANPHAPQGGEIVLGWIGAFDTLNPFAIKGLPPIFLQSLVVATLGDASLDEPFAKYPYIAKSFTLAKDKLSLVVELDPSAKFSDGAKVTAQDILFSFELFRTEEVPSQFRSYWADIDKVEIESSSTVVFKFKKLNPELPLIVGELPIMPKHFYQIRDFSKLYFDKILGAGPYIVEKYKFGSYITFKKNPNFWGKNKLLNRGRYNFEHVTIKYYQDQAAQLEGLKKGDFDLLWVLVAKTWMQDLVGKNFTSELIRKEVWPHDNNRGGQGFFYNLRRKKFQDVRVRKAIALAFDFNWANESLFFNQYTENTSYFENSEFKAEGMPSEEEKKVLLTLGNKYPGFLPEGVLSLPTASLGRGLSIRERLKLAFTLLEEAGYKIDPNKKMVDAQGNGLEIDFLISSPAIARVIEPFAQNLKTIGIILNIETKEEAVYAQRLQARDFDMICLALGQSESPGNEQKDYWTSASADEAYSNNYFGLKNPIIDELVEKIVYSGSRSELFENTRLLDRVLYHLFIAVHNWHADSYWVAYWDKFSHPTFPKFYSPLSFIEYMWTKNLNSQGH